MNFSRLFFLLSFIFFIAFIRVFYEQNKPQNLTFAEMGYLRPAKQVKEESTTPTGIVIPSAHIWLPIYPATIRNGNWETSNKGISYLVGSASIGTTGNAIFYGHDWPNLLGNLKEIKPGDLIQIVTKTGQQFSFEVSTTQEVDPTDVSVLANTNDVRITLYTCSGIFDSRRFVVVALQKKV